MGTPSDTNWPGVQQLPDWKPKLSQMERQEALVHMH